MLREAYEGRFVGPTPDLELARQLKGFEIWGQGDPGAEPVRVVNRPRFGSDPHPWTDGAIRLPADKCWAEHPTEGIKE